MTILYLDHAVNYLFVSDDDVTIDDDNVDNHNHNDNSLSRKLI